VYVGASYAFFSIKFTYSSQRIENISAADMGSWFGYSISCCFTFQ